MGAHLRVHDKGRGDSIQKGFAKADSDNKLNWFTAVRSGIPSFAFVFNMK